MHRGLPCATFRQHADHVDLADPAVTVCNHGCHQAVASWRRSWSTLVRGNPRRASDDGSRRGRTPGFASRGDGSARVASSREMRVMPSPVTPRHSSCPESAMSHRSKPRRLFLVEQRRWSHKFVQCRACFEAGLPPSVTIRPSICGACWARKLRRDRRCAGGA